MRVKLDHHVQGRCWLGQDVETHKPVYVYIRDKSHKSGDEFDYYLTDLGEHWEVGQGVQRCEEDNIQL